MQAFLSIRRAAARGVLATLAALCLGGCAGIQAVQAWEKGLLARPDMGFEGDRLESNFAEHTYSSKEGSSGGAGVGGGGCGCN